MEKKSSVVVSANETVPDISEDEKPFEFGIRLEIDNFSKVPINEKILSPPCIVHNLAWRIMIKRTVRYGESKLGYFLVCEPDSTKVKGTWRCKATARLYIINREDPIDHFTREVTHVFCAEENDWGFTTFCDWDYISNPKKPYISNDCAKFDICIIADRPEGIDMSCDSFSNVKKPSRRQVKNVKTEAKYDHVDVLERLEQIEKYQRDTSERIGLLTTTLRDEMRTLIPDLMNGFLHKLVVTFGKTKPEDPVAEESDESVESDSDTVPGSRSEEVVPVECESSHESESENAAVVPQMTTGATVHWFGPNKRLPLTEDDEIEDKLVRLSIEEQENDEDAVREHEKNVLNDTNEKKRKVEKIIEHNASGEEKRSKKTSAETSSDDDTEISDISSDDFEIISVDDDDDNGPTEDKISNVSYETVSNIASDGQKSDTTDDTVKTDAVNTGTMRKVGVISEKSAKALAAERIRLVNFVNMARGFEDCARKMQQARDQSNSLKVKNQIS